MNPKAYDQPTSSTTENFESQTQPNPPPTKAVVELLDTLNQRKTYREVPLALGSGIKNARVEFSFLRVRGLRRRLKFLRSVPDSDSTIEVFCLTQSLAYLQCTENLSPISIAQRKETKIKRLPGLNVVCRVQ
ncbi:uncharacterized protein LOC141630210 [Silene latifolia]|uniref:uncharacterized protein LOC141630210 n=1 Tax=Silene latifolia TaxID=37657 RepID=UPI003D778D59